MKKMTKRRMVLTLAAGVALAASFGLGPAPAQAQGYFEGKTLTLVVPNSPSGRMSQYAQMIAPYIEKHSGADTVRLEYMQGAGGLKGANYIWHQKPDGTVFAFTSIPTMILAQLAGSEGVQLDATEYTYLGRVATEGRVLATGSVSGLASVADMQAMDGEFIYPSQGTDEDFYTMAILADALGLNLKMVTGFEGNADTQLSVIKGEGHGHLTAWSSALGPINAGDMKPVISVSEERNPDFPDVPTALEVVPPENAAAVEAVVNMLAMHRGFFGPPNMDPEAAAALREAIAAALADPELIAESERTGMFLLPSPGNREQERIVTVVAASESIKPVLQKALASLQ
jgi:tripartite-type tricarboxylate transporter receptor subunit TctC